MKVSNTSWWLFVPLGIGFILLAVAIADLKHPVVQTDTCRLVGRGLEVQAFKTHAQVLYRRSGKNEDDIAFTCNHLGDVVVNEHVPVPLTPGQTTQLVIKQYKYFPTRYLLNLSLFSGSDAPKKP